MHLQAAAITDKSRASCKNLKSPLIMQATPVSERPPVTLSPAQRQIIERQLQNPVAATSAPERSPAQLASPQARGLSQSKGQGREQATMAAAAAAMAAALSLHRPSSTHSSPCLSTRGEALSLEYHLDQKPCLQSPHAIPMPSVGRDWAWAFQRTDVCKLASLVWSDWSVPRQPHPLSVPISYRGAS